MSALRLLSALLAGMIFGFGLALSGMLDPARVRGFLDIAGAWDPTLGFVMAGAVAAASLGTLLKFRLSRPAFAPAFQMPSRTRIDGRLVLGSAIFGIGWGMAGLCPGPALADLTLGLPAVLLFVLAMAAGMLLHDRLARRSAC